MPPSRSGRGALEVATQAATAAGKLIMEHFHGEMRISYKPGRSNIVTDVDVLSEETIIGLLQDEYPDFGVIAEESDEIAPESPYRWVIDPIDGTRNYAHGIPHFCVSIALSDASDVVLGVIHDPVRGETFTGEKGRGPLLNGAAVAISERTSLEDSLVGFDMGYSAERGREMLKVAGALWPGVQSVRVMGSAALGLAYTACGRLDLYVNLSLSAWDLAAGILLVREAGGLVTEPGGTAAGLRSRSIVAANRSIHADFVSRREKAG
ncbi:MAG: inositol monophosphatase family protein [Chloroflexota bacterium]|nr:inositol monophosphatase family protein [Chloroflexota bacterium]